MSLQPFGGDRDESADDRVGSFGTGGFVRSGFPAGVADRAWRPRLRHRLRWRVVTIAVTVTTTATRLTNQPLRKLVGS
jgi:hypothetical protein